MSAVLLITSHPPQTYRKTGVISTHFAMPMETEVSALHPAPLLTPRVCVGWPDEDTRIRAF